MVLITATTMNTTWLRRAWQERSSGHQTWSERKCYRTEKLCLDSPIPSHLVEKKTDLLLFCLSLNNIKFITKKLAEQQNKPCGAPCRLAPPLSMSGCSPREDSRSLLETEKRSDECFQYLGWDILKNFNL